MVNGGNRAGKTDLGAQWAVAHALGRDHPHTRAWLEANGLDGRHIQPGPGMVWAVSLTFPDSRRYVRDKLDRYLPAGTRCRNWTAENEAQAVLPNGGKIVCKAWAQGREGFQGDAIHAVWCDEEPGDEPAWNELLMRLADYDGRALITFTPGLMGLTWVYERYAKVPQPTVAATVIFGTDNPHVSPDVLRELLSQFGAGERAARERGEWVQLEGRVWPQWRRDLHVVAAAALPVGKVDGRLVIHDQHPATLRHLLAQALGFDPFERGHVMFMQALAHRQMAQGVRAQVQAVEVAHGHLHPVMPGIVGGGLVPVAVGGEARIALQLGDPGQAVRQHARCGGRKNGPGGQGDGETTFTRSSRNEDYSAR